MFEADGRLLEAHGHTVVRYERHNDDVEGLSALQAAASTFWNREAHAEIGRLVTAHGIDVAHFHNTLPLVSPAGYYAARKAGAAVVQTLHNYRLVCPGNTLFRDGAPCESCVGKRFAFDAVRHACYRNSRGATAAVAAMTTAHWRAGTWDHAVDRYIAITDFAHAVFVRGGLPPEKLAVKPNFLSEDPGAGEGGGGFALFVGRLDRPKGMGTVLAAWALDPSLPPLVVVGDGDMGAEVEAAAGADPRIRFLRWQSHAAVLDLMRRADALLFMSEWYEGGTPMTLVEAAACGLPVVASDHGTMATMIEPGVNGVRVPARQPAALAACVSDLFGDPVRLAALRAGARRAYDRLYSAEANYPQLLAIYDAALRERHGHAA